LIYDYKINVKGSFNLKQFDKVLIIGLGKLDLPIARYVKEKGFDTYGLDSNPKAVEMARNAAIEKAVNFVSLMSLSSVFLHTNQMTCFLHK